MRKTQSAALTLTALIGIGTMALSATSVSAQAPFSASMGVSAQLGHRERHPALRVALRSLMRARMALQHGSRDFSGHRAQALELTNQAIAQVQQAIQADHG